MADTPQYALGTNAQGQGMGSIIPTISSASLAPTTPVQMPPTPTPINTAAANASVPNPVAPVNPNPPIPGQTGTGTTTTPSVTTPTNTDAQNQQSDILNRISSLMGGNTSLATLQNQQETTAGVPALTKTVNDINTQLMGLDAQSQKLQLDAGAGGTIQNQNTNAAIGRMGTAGLAGANAESLRNNQIQQASIAGQALTLKSVLYGAQQSYSMAKTAADAAAQSVYDATTQQINYEKAKLDAIAPQLTRDQATQAANQKAALDQQAKQADYQRQDNVAGNGLIQAAMQNFPNDAQAHYAIQQAAQIPLTDPQYLSKVQALVGQYQSNPQAVQKAVLENSLLRQQISKATYDAQKAQYDAKAAAPTSITGTSGNNTKWLSDFYGSGGTVPLPSLGMGSAAVKMKTGILNGIAESAQKLNISGAQMSAIMSDKNAAQKAMTTIDKNQGMMTVAESTASRNFDQINTMLDTIPPKTLSPLLNQFVQTGQIQTGDPNLKPLAALITSSLNEYAKVITGQTSGTAVSDASRKEAQSFMSVSDNNQSIKNFITTAKQEMGNRNSGYQDAKDKMFGIIQNPQASLGSNSNQTQTVQSNGQSYTVGQVYNDGTANWIVDANGKWTKQ